MNAEQGATKLPTAENLTKWRVYSCLFGIFIGAWLGAAILVFLKLTSQIWAKPSMFLFALASSVSMGLLGMIVGLPLAGFAVALGLPFWWDATVSLPKVLGVTTFAIGMLLAAEMFAKGGSPKEALLVLASSLASAAICWRITRKWHSPEYTK